MAVSWINAFERCKAFDMDLVELPTAAESDLFLTLCTEQQIPLKELDFHVGGSYHGVGLNEFYWMTTGKRVNYTLKWGSGEPNSPNKETCLAITKNKGIFLFNDIDCILSPCNFICQRNTIKKSESVVDPADSKIPSIVTQCKPASIEW